MYHISLTFFILKLMINKWFKSENLLFYVFLYLIFSFLVHLLTISIYYFVQYLNPNFIFNSSSKPFVNLTHSVWLKFIAVVLIAPIYETFLFQYLIITTLLGKINTKWVIFISSFFFGLSHFYNFFYILNAFFVGIVLAFAYVNWNGKKQSPFLVVFLIHSLHNLLIFFIEVMF